MERLSKQDIVRIMAFVVGKINNTQKIIISEINSDFKSATFFVSYISQKYNMSKTAVWHSFRQLCKYNIIVNSGKPGISSFGKKIKEVINNAK